MQKEPTWTLVIVLLIFFMPLGLYFLARKSRVNLAAGLWMQICGWYNVLMAFALFITMIDPEYATGGEGWGVLFFGIFAVLFLVIGFKNRRRIRRCRYHIDYIINHEIYSIDKIAILQNKSYESVLKDLKFLYDCGYFIGKSYLDAPNRVIVPITTPIQNENSQEKPTKDKVNLNKPKRVQCSGCGASNLVKVGKVTECEYCGTPING